MFGPRSIFRHWFLHPLISATVFGSMMVSAAPPAWWGQGNPPVIAPNAIPNNHGVANVGQAKWMAKSALETIRGLDGAMAGRIEANLVGPGKPIADWDAPTGQAEQEKQKAALLVGQLKAIAAPFYQELHTTAPTWLAAERTANGTNTGDGYFPWTSSSSDDANRSLATIGQLKSVFSLHFTESSDSDQISDFLQSYQMPNGDQDGDGLPDAWENENAGKFAVWPGELHEELFPGQSSTRSIILNNATNHSVDYALSVVNNRRGYTWKDSITGGQAFVWEDISASGVGTKLQNVSDTDDGTQAVDLGFSFPLYGVGYSRLWVNSNGTVAIDQYGTSSWNSALPNDAAPGGLIAALWQDLNPGASSNDGDVYYKEDGVVGQNKRLIVQYSNVRKRGSSTIKYTFQIVLHESGKIEYRYLTLGSSLNTCTVGIQNQTGNDGVTVVHNAPYLQNNLIVVFEPAEFFHLQSHTATLASGAHAAFDGQFRGLDLVPGQYEATVKVTSNDTVSPLITVPATLLVKETPATVELKWPLASTPLVQGADMSLLAVASHAEKVIDRVKFRVDGIVVDYDYADEDIDYHGVWSNLPVGPHEVTAVAVTETGWETVSAPVAVMVHADVDHDGMSDTWESTHGMNPADPSDGGLDADNDGARNREEFLLGFDPNDADSDNDSIADGLENSDNDGLPDAWELRYFRTLFEASSGGDNDSDGLTNLEEMQEGTNPSKKDSDGDSMPDKWELTYGLNPLDAGDGTLDSDLDHISNVEEYRLSQFPPYLVFNPTLVDSDGDSLPDDKEDRDADGLFDYWELRYFGDPTSAVAGGDMDSDDLTNMQEQTAETNPKVKDTDGDGMPDGWEITHGLNPLDNSDKDADADQDDVPNIIEYILGWDPQNEDSDGDLGATDGKTDGEEDRDGDGLPDYWEQLYFGSPISAIEYRDTDFDKINNTIEYSIGTDPNKIDTDGDGLQDGFEHLYRSNGFDPLVAASAAELGLDVDGDGLNVVEEYLNGCDPSIADSDHDGFQDKVEVDGGTDPLDPQSKPINFNLLKGDLINDPRVSEVGDLGVFYKTVSYQARGVIWGGSPPYMGYGPWGCRYQLNFGEKIVQQQTVGAGVFYNVNLTGNKIWDLTASIIDGVNLDKTNDPWGRLGYCVADGFIQVEEIPVNIYGLIDFRYSVFGAGGNNSPPPAGTIHLIPLTGAGYVASYSGNDAVGPRYRKVALNGTPISDAKPEQEEESETNNEETYVDAFNLSLHHDTSYVHVPLGASDLALEVTASACETNWSNRSGLRPREELTQPFGVCWSSNLCSYVEIIETLGVKGTDPVAVNVVDEGGRSQRFGTKGQDTNGNQTFFAWPSSQVDKKTYLNTLKKITDAQGEALVLTKKYGNKLTYRPSKAWFLYSGDRLKAGETARKHVYWRLAEVEDRFGQKVSYDYGDSEISLIPQKIEAVGRANQQILIDRSNDGRRVDAVTDPLGKITRFIYDSVSIREPGTGEGLVPEVKYNYTRLERVRYADNTEVHYTYDVVPDEELVTGTQTYHYHANLKSIKNAKGNQHSFEYEFDRTRKGYSESFTQAAFAVPIISLPAYYQAIAEEKLDAINDAKDPANTGNYRVQYGVPRLVKKVTLPGGAGFSQFGKTAGSAIQYGPNFEASSGTEVTDVLGRKVKYVFGDVTGEIVNTDTRTIDGVANISKEWMLYYKSMEIQYFGDENTMQGSERFEFDLRSGLCLSKTVDFCGNVTTWEYEQALPSNDVPRLSENPNFMTVWADPTSKTDALGREETYEYGNYRMMSKYVNVHGTETSYLIDAKGRRKNQIVKDATGSKLSEETFVYGDEDTDATSNLPGFLSERTVKAFSSWSGKAWEQDLVTLNVPDAWGRLSQQIVDPGGLHLVSAYGYDLNNQKKSVTDPKNLTTSFDYDNRNRLEKVTYADGKFKTFHYDANGDKEKEVDENGNATLWQRDDLRRVTKKAVDFDHSGSLSAGDITTSMEYNKLGQVQRVIDPRGYAVVTFYDDLNRPQHVFKGVPSSTAYQFATVMALATANRDVTYDELFYDVAKNTGGGLLNAFKPTKTIRHKAVSSDRNSADVSLASEASYDDLYRPLVVSSEYTPGMSATTETIYGTVANGREALVTTVIDPLDKQTRTTADGLGRVVEVIDGYGLSDPNLIRTSTTQHTSTGLAWRVVDPLQRHAETEYDRAGRAVKVWQPDPVTGLVSTDSPMTETMYDDNGNVEAVIDPLLRRTDFSYDNRNRKWRTQAPAVTNAADPDAPINNIRPTSTTEYDDAGRVIAVTDARGSKTRTFYDRANRPIKVRSNPVTGQPSANVDSPGTNDITVQTVYDDAGLALSVTDGNSNVTRNAYDGLGRLIATITDPVTGNPADPASSGFNAASYRSGSPTGILVTNAYDDSGNLIEVTDGKGQITGFTYDGLARKTRTIWDPGTSEQRVELAEYNELYLTKRTDAMNRVTLYLYDDLYRLEDVVYGPVGSATTSSHSDNRHFSYDRMGKVLEVSFPNESNFLRGVVCTYDKLDRLTSETSAGVTHTYSEYDKVGNRKRTTYGRTGTTLVSSYDALNRLEECEERSNASTPSGRYTRYAYDLGSVVTRKTLPNGAATTTSRDKLGRTLAITEKDSNGTVISAFDYAQPVNGWPSSHDAAGNVLRCAETYSQAGMVNRVVSNTYDHCYRLDTETITPTGGAAAVTAYGYDLANNRTSKTAGGVTTAYVFGNGVNGANSNQLKSYGPAGQAATCSFTYDDNGNRETRVTAAGTDNYVWDFENRLISLTVANGNEYNYGYDYRSRRLIRDETQAGGANVILSFSGGLSVQEADASNNVQCETIRGSDWGGGVGGILYTVRGGQRSYNAYNSRGDVVSTTDDSGAATWQGAYEAFGTRTAEQGTNDERQRANTKEEDPTGLLNEGFRYRDLEAGVFISRDPAGFVDGPNVYTYVRQNPWTAFDPLGLAEVENWYLQQSWAAQKEPVSFGSFCRGAGYGIIGAVQGAFQGSWEICRNDIPQGFAQSREDIRQREEQGKAHFIEVGIGRLGVTAGETLTAYGTVPANLDRIACGVYHFPGKAYGDVKDFIAKPTMCGGCDVLEDASIVYGLKQLAGGLFKGKVKTPLITAQEIQYSTRFKSGVIEIQASTKTGEFAGGMMGRFDPVKKSLYVDFVGVPTDAQKLGIGAEFYRRALEMAGDVEEVVGVALLDNLDAINKGGIMNAPRTKILDKLGDWDHSYDPETQIMKATRKK